MSEQQGLSQLAVANDIPRDWEFLNGSAWRDLPEERKRKIFDHLYSVPFIAASDTIVEVDLRPGGVCWSGHLSLPSGIAFAPEPAEPEPPEVFGEGDDTYTIAGQRYRVRPRADMTARECYWLLRFEAEYTSHGEDGREYEQETVLAWLAERDLLRHLEPEGGNER